MQLIEKISQSTINLDILFEKKCLITFVNPYSYYLLRKNNIIIHNYDYVLIDGISLVFAFRLFNIKVKRYSFDMTSIFPKLVSYCIKNDKSIYFVGAREEEIRSSIRQFRSSYGKLNIIGYRNGYFSGKESMSEAINQIIKLNPSVVICGMGTPKQEEFLINLKNTGFKGIGFTCGGFLHQSSDKLNYYPNLVDKLNLRWAYRIMDEPKLLKRYCILYPLAFGFIFRDLCRFKILNRKKNNVE